MPDTSGYLILGYAAVVLFSAGLIAYLVIRNRNLHAELKMLETLQEEPAEETPRPEPSPREDIRV
ncbi:MAG TPA: hypothetical protein VMT34_06880 [Aggregatilineales bacterium]|nr:hypothetical protein [Aggregatilineales bacterium]